MGANTPELIAIFISCIIPAISVFFIAKRIKFGRPTQIVLAVISLIPGVFIISLLILAFARVAPAHTDSAI